MRSSRLGSLTVLWLLLLLVACHSLVPTTPTVQLSTQAATVTPDLITAAAEGDVATVTALLAAGTPVNESNQRGSTPLIAAARQNQVEVARLLIEAGADVNRQDNSRQSAYLISTSEGYLELLKLTLANGADVHSLDFFNGTGLIRAADRGHVEIVAELLTTDIAIDHVNRLGWTALLEAIILGDGGERHTEVVRLLVAAGADVNLADANGVTPLAHAQQRDYAAMVTILAAAGARASEPLPLPTFTPVATAVPPDPLTEFTIAALRDRPFSGGTIERQTLLLENDLYTQYAIAYPSDGLTITGLLYEPAGSGPFPVLILLHGYWPREEYMAGTDTAAAAEFFAGQGYLVLAPDLRSWGDSDSGLSLFHMGLVIDVLHLIGSVASLPAADPARIALWGHSMGGGLATKALVIDNRIRAALLYAPNSADDADLIARWGIGCLPGQAAAAGDMCNPADIILPGTAPELIARYQQVAADPGLLQLVAPIYHLQHIQAPVQIHIGTADGGTVAATPPEWSYKLADAMSMAGASVTLFTYEGQGHFFNGDSWDQLLDRALSFYATHLKSEAAGNPVASVGKDQLLR